MGSSLGRNNTSVKTTRLSTQNELAVSGLIMAMNCLAEGEANIRVGPRTFANVDVAVNRLQSP